MNSLEEVNNNEQNPSEEKDPPQTPKSTDPATETKEPASTVCSNPECTRSRPGTTSENVCVHVQPQTPVDKPKTPAG